MTTIEIINVFSAGAGGGNPAPIVVDADGMSDREMQEVAQYTGHESAFVLRPDSQDSADFVFRFWVPNHEMEMCGHATVAATWLLAQTGRLVGDRVAIRTKSGIVDARISRDGARLIVEISQPAGRLESVDDSMATVIAEVLGISQDALAPYPIQNATTSRTKTLIPLRDVQTLNGLTPQLARIERLCEDLNSTGLYPYAINNGEAQLFEARQFPKSSGYPEDAATGIAAAALTFGLLKNGLLTAPQSQVTIRQGFAMGKPSQIKVTLRFSDGQAIGCWLTGSAERSVDSGNPAR